MYGKNLSDLDDIAFNSYYSVGNLELINTKYFFYFEWLDVLYIFYVTIIGLMLNETSLLKEI